MIKLEDINKIYSNGIQAVFDLNLSIEKKDFLVLVGPSGCGKSTILRMIAGLEEISSGNLILNKKVANTYSPKQRKVSMVFQNYALYPHLTVYKNIYFPLENNKKALFLYYKNNWLLRKQIKKEKCLLMGMKRHQINELTNIDNSLIENKFLSKEKNLDLVSKILKTKLETKNKINIYLANIKLKNSGIQNLFLPFKKEVLGLKKQSKNCIKKHKNNNKTHLEKFKRKFKELKKEKKKILHDFRLYKSSYDKKKFKIIKKDLTKKYKIKNPYLKWKKDNDNKVKWAAEILGLFNYLYRKPGDLSGGQRQRVALGRSIVRNPEIFLLDEPLSNLDAKLRSSMRETILSVHNKIDAATIYVTHDQVEAMTMATKIVVLKDGFAQQIGKPEEVYSKPSNMFVASFVGSPEINFFEGVLKNNYFVSNELKIKVLKSQLETLQEYKDKKIILGIRPEHFSSWKIVRDTFKNSEINFKIKSKELLGKEVIFYGTMGNSKKTRRVVLNTSDIFIKDNNILTLGINMNKIHFFNPVTKESTYKHNEETNTALKIWKETKRKREVNKKLLEKERKKGKNKGVLKKLFKICKNINQKLRNKTAEEKNKNDK